MIVSDNTIEAEGLRNFSKNLGKRTKCMKRTTESMLSNPSRALDITANVANAVACRNPKAPLPTLPGLIIFHNAGKSFYLEKIV